MNEEKEWKSLFCTEIIDGNVDKHLKNFASLNEGNGEYLEAVN